MSDPRVRVAKKKFIQAQTTSVDRESEYDNEPDQGESPIRLPTNAYAWKVPPRPKKVQSPDVLDPFAIKISIPPLVLFIYVIYKYFSGPDIRFERIRDAERMHMEYLEDLHQEENSTQALRKLSSK